MFAPTSSPGLAASALLLETRLSSPILAIGTGRFDASSPRALALAVLHPRALTVYAVEEVVDTSGGGGGGGGGARALRRLYEHAFGAHFSAANMAWGTFGASATAPFTNSGASARERDCIAVQSLDGQVAIFEGTIAGAVVSLEGVLLPAPLAYIAKSDTLVTLTTDMQLAGWKYATLARAPPPPAPPLRPDWTVNIGENAAWLLVGRTVGTLPQALSTSMRNASASVNEPLEVVVVGDHAMTVVCDPGSGGSFAAAAALDLSASAAGIGIGTGGTAAAAAIAGSAVASHTRFDAMPIAACLYAARGAEAADVGRAAGCVLSGDGSSGAAAASRTATPHNVLVALTNGSLRVYSHGGESLLWAARLDIAPVAVAVGRFESTPGLIVALSARGDVTAVYLGTDPPAGSPTGGEPVREMDLVGENAALAAKIKAIQAAAAAEAESANASVSAGTTVGARANPAPPLSGIVLRAVTPSTSDEIDAFSSDCASWEADPAGDVSPPAPTLSVLIYVSYVAPPGAAAVADIKLHISTPPWVLARSDDRTRTITGVGAREIAVAIPLRAMLSAGIPADNCLRVAAVAGSAGDARVASLAVALPLALGGAPAPPIKNGAFKIVIEAPAPSDGAPPRSLSSLFSDVLSAPHPPRVLAPDAAARIAANAATLFSWSYFCGGDASVLVSKTAPNRFRVQGGSLAQLAPLTTELVNRLVALAPTQPLLVTGPLPLSEWAAAVDAHLVARRARDAAGAALAARALEVRLCVKRMLIRFREKAPVPLVALESLLNATLAHATAAAAELTAAADAEAESASQLTALTQLLRSLLVAGAPALREAPYAAALAAALPLTIGGAGAGAPDSGGPSVGAGGTDPGWEEICEANLTALLRARSGPFADPRDGGCGGRLDDDGERITVGTVPATSGRLLRLVALLAERVGTTR